MNDTASWLYWKFEDGPEDSEEDEDPNDIGPAWIRTPEGTDKQVNGGVRITRAEARWLAAEYGYELREDG